MPDFSTRKAAASLGLLACVYASGYSQLPVDLKPDDGADALSKECLLRLTPQLKSSDGSLSPALKKAYLDWCWGTILKNLQLKQRSVSEATMSDVASDAQLREAVSASVYPPDPSILQNYDILRKEMGAGFTAKYRNLAIGISVARRIHGVEFDPGDGIGRENQTPIWAYEPVHRPRTQGEKQFISHLVEFMQVRNCSPSDLFEKPEVQLKLKAALAGIQVEKQYLDEIGKTTAFGERLKNAMIEMGKRPNGRTPDPNCIDWLKHLVKVYESRPASTPGSDGHSMPWPLFPMESAPWPLLMPLSHPVPLDEATYLWETFQGQHGEDRYHTYGPYRDDLTAMPDMLRPSKWYWNAVPDQVIHGGQCMPISRATIDLYASLCKPVMGAGQPGHANLVTFQNDGGTWKAEVEQDFAGGPRVTYSAWYFDDPAREDMRFRNLFGWAGAEYHLGLATAMNLGLDSYISTRISARIFDVLPAKAKATLGEKLLQDAIRTNPFNPEVWYRLGSSAPNVQKGLVLVKVARAHNPNSLAGGFDSPAMSKFTKSGLAGPALGGMNDYWSVLQENLSRFTVLAKGAPEDEASMHEAYRVLSDTPGISGEDLSNFTKRYAGTKTTTVAAQGAEYDRKLADQGNAFGCMRMGQRYLDRDGVVRDSSRARDYYIRAARLGEASAAAALETINVPLSNEGIEVIASSTYSPTQDVHHLINGAGLNGGIHDNSGPADTMWQTIDNPASTVPAPGIPASPAWVRFNFDKPRAFDAVEIWNHNQANLTDRGFHKFTIYGTSDGKVWAPLTRRAELARASGNPNEPCETVPTLSSGWLLKSVIIAAATKDGNYGSVDYGLSAVRFVCHPVFSAVPSYQVQVRASSQFSNSQSANHLIDGSGMIGEFHDNHGGAATMWQTPERQDFSLPAPLLPSSPAWVRFNFSTPRYLEAIRIWNHNQLHLTNRGLKKVRIYGTSDGVSWFPLTHDEWIQIPQANGAPLSAGINFFNAAPERPIRSVVISADSDEGNWGGNAYGLSAVRFIVPATDPVLPSALPDPSAK